MSIADYKMGEGKGTIDPDRINRELITFTRSTQMRGYFQLRQCVAGAYQWHTNFRDWIRFELLFTDRDVPMRDKKNALLRIIFPIVPPDSNLWEFILWFYQCGKESRGAKSDSKSVKAKKQAAGYSFEHDDGYIYAALMDVYGIDITALEELAASAVSLMSEQVIPAFIGGVSWIADNSYQIRVSCGYDTKGNQVEQSMTWEPEEDMTERQIQKELNRVAVKFEDDCMNGHITAAVKFQDFAEQWFKSYQYAQA